MTLFGVMYLEVWLLGLLPAVGEWGVSTPLTPSSATRRKRRLSAWLGIDGDAAQARRRITVCRAEARPVVRCLAR